MIKINKYRYKIEDGDKKAANLRNWNNSNYTVIGNLAEIASCKYLGLEWTTASRAVADIIDDDGMRYQVKSCKEGFEKKKVSYPITSNRMVCENPRILSLSGAL